MITLERDDGRHIVSFHACLVLWIVCYRLGLVFAPILRLSFGVQVPIVLKRDTTSVLSSFQLLYCTLVPLVGNIFVLSLSFNLPRARIAELDLSQKF